MAQAAQPAPALAPAPPAPAPKPWGAPPSDSCRRLKGEAWWTQMRMDMQKPKELEIGSYCIDEDSLFTALGDFLPDCKVNLYIDEEQFDDPKKTLQRTKVRKLHKRGAKVYVMKRLRRWGSYHCKLLIINRRVMYFGSSNFTNKSHDNRESTFRATGTVVEDRLEDATEWRLAGKLWDGKAAA